MYDGVFDNQIGAAILLLVVAPNLLIYMVARGVNSVIISIRARNAPKLPIEIYARPQAQTPEIVPPPAEPVLVRPPKLSSKLKSEKIMDITLVLLIVLGLAGYISSTLKDGDMNKTLGTTLLLTLPINFLGMFAAFIVALTEPRS